MILCLSPNLNQMLQLLPELYEYVSSNRQCGATHSQSVLLFDVSILTFSGIYFSNTASMALVALVVFDIVFFHLFVISSQADNVIDYFSCSAIAISAPSVCPSPPSQWHLIFVQFSFLLIVMHL